MDLHSRALTCPGSRALLVQRVTGQGWTVEAAAQALGISRRTGYKWLSRHRQEGAAGLRDRSSRPRRIANATPLEWEELVVGLRHLRMTGPTIARQLKLPRSTVARVLRRAGLERLKRLEPRDPVVRYERSRPGELLHLDVKKLVRIRGVGHRIHGDRHRMARGVGWEFVHVAVDDYSRVAYVEVLPNETGLTTAAFLQRAMNWFRRRGITIERILTDNGTNYRSRIMAEACHQYRIRHLRTRPYRPCTNGKAERFIQTMIREWAYAAPYESSTARTRALPGWLRYYNGSRPHGSINGEPPFSRLPV
jgi:transposase InsO family protein